MSQRKTVRVYEELTHRIVNLELAPGAPINEANLALSLGVSKTPIREALRELESDGLVVSVLGRGSAVAPITVREIVDVFQMREIIESAAAREASVVGMGPVLRHELEKERTMLTRQHGMEEAIDSWGTWEDVHLMIVQALGNALLVDVYSRIIKRISRIRNHYTGRFTTRRFHDILKEHVAILTAIEEGDGVVAETAMMSHLQKAGIFVSGLAVDAEGVTA